MRVYFVLLFCLTLTSAPARGALLGVAPGGAGDYPTIQAAIDAAAPGDTVLAAPGTYTGDGNRELDFGGKDLVLLGEAGAAATILELELHRGFQFQSGETRAAIVRGFTIQHGRHLWAGSGVYIEDSSPSLFELIFFENELHEYALDGAAIHSLDASPLLRDVEIRNSLEGGGMVCIGGSPELEDVLFQQNFHTGNGGGLICVDSAARLTDVVFRNNWIDEAKGGGMYCAGSPAPVLTRVLFDDNLGGEHMPTGTLAGMGMAIEGSSPTLTDVVFRNNRSGSISEARGGGLYLHEASPLLQNLVFEGNDVQFGSAIAIDGGSPTLTGVTIARQGSDDWPGSTSVICENGATPHFERVIIAYSLGIGIDSYGGSAPTFVCCDVFGNAGGNYAGSIVDPTGSDGNISLDPGFCYNHNPPEPLGLISWSPCLPENNECGQLIGALGQLCDFGAVTISGRIVDDAGDPLAGVSILGGNVPTNTGPEGYYAAVVSWDWSGTLRPLLAGHVFQPSQRVYAELQFDLADQDYEGRFTTLHRVPSEQPHLLAAFQAAQQGDTVLVASGLHSGPENRGLSFGGREILVMSEQGSDSTFIDCAYLSRAFTVSDGEGPAAELRGFTFIAGFGGTENGGALRIENSSPTLRDLRVTESFAWSGGGIALENSGSLLESVIVDNCDAFGEGGGIYVSGGAPLLRNVSLLANDAAQAGGGIAIAAGATVTMATCLVHGNEGHGIFIDDSGASLAISCSDVQGNVPGDYSGNASDQTGMNGNIAADPELCNFAGRDYHLASYSPCLPENNDCAMLIGKYGAGCWMTPAAGDSPSAPFALEQNVPNPFNPRTEIRFALPAAASVSLEIFDLAGRRVRELLAGRTYPGGTHALSWNGRDDANRSLPSGVYFYRLESGQRSLTRKMTLLR